MNTTTAAPKLTCDRCPFTTSDPAIARGHEAGPSTGRGWFGQYEAHRMSASKAATR